jgi:2-succinyl-5-enolpyruvyl-6-hydroxy-3-cyclohexene-1-carboxylate synthase
VPRPTTVAAADALVRAAPVEGWRPDAVLRLGRPWASRVLGAWLDGLGPDAVQVLVDPYGRWADPERSAGRVLRADPTLVSGALAAAAGRKPAGWAERWGAAEAAAQQAFDQVLAGHGEVTEPGVARVLGDALPDGATLVASSSMPVRDVEWYLRPRSGLRVLANRGANGIDGVVSTALGVAQAGDRPTVALLGDLAFLYDAGALLGASGRGLTCTLVVVDNGGGGIFSFLPHASRLPKASFERLWATPHGADLAAIAAAYGIPVEVAGRAQTVGAAVEAATTAGGVRMVLARTEREANVAVHDELNSAVAAAVAALDV